MTNLGAMPTRHQQSRYAAAMSTPIDALTPEQTERLTRRGLRLAQFTIAYNVAEGVVAVTAGLVADWCSSSGSASTRQSNQWPRSWSPCGSPLACGTALRTNAKNGPLSNSSPCRITGRDAHSRASEEPRRRRLARQPHPGRRRRNQNLRTAEHLNPARGWLVRLTGAAWLDPVAGFIIAIFAIHEGREAWHGELVDEE